MFEIWIVFHVIVCLGLILVVLLQSSKGEGLAGSAFGGGGGGGGGISGAVFGGRGAASFLSKATTFLAVVFMFNCGALAFMSSSGSTSAIDNAGDGTTNSVVTREASKEQQEQLQRLQDQAVDSANRVQPIQVVPNSAAPTTPAQDTSGK